MDWMMGLMCSGRGLGRLALLMLFVFGSLAVGCSRTQDGPEASADPDAAGDSSAVAQVDSSAAPNDSGGNFFTNLFNRDKDEEEEQEEFVPVELVAVAVQDMPAYLGTTATLQSEKSADILAKIDGEIRTIRVEEGDWVQKGQVLASLDGAAQQVALEEAQARRHAVEQDLERARALREQNLASEKDLHDALYKYEESEAQYKGAQLRVDYTRIIAPFSGQIADRHVDLGQTVAPGAQIFTIVDRDPLLARIHLPEREAVKILPGQEVVISPDNDLSQSVPGTVLRVAPVVDPRTGTVKVTCQVSGATPGLRPGSFVRVRVQTDMHPEVLTVPKRALVPEGADIYVFKADADSVIKTEVVTGLANHLNVEVTDGLAAGDRVVTVGHGALKTGSKIRELKTTQAAIADSSPGATQ